VALKNVNQIRGTFGKLLTPLQIFYFFCGKIKISSSETQDYKSNILKLRGLLKTFYFSILDQNKVRQTVFRNHSKILFEHVFGLFLTHYYAYKHTSSSKSKHKWLNDIPKFKKKKLTSIFQKSNKIVSSLR